MRLLLPDIGLTINGRFTNSKFKSIIDAYDNKYYLDENKNGYLVLAVNDNLLLSWKVVNNEIYYGYMGFHHINNTILELDSFAYGNDNEYCKISSDGLEMGIELFNTYENIKYDSNKKYICQISLYVYDFIDIYKDEEEYKQTLDYQDTGLRDICTNIICINPVDNSEIINPLVFLTGIVKEIKQLTNPYKGEEYLEVIIDSYKHDYTCYFRCNSFSNLQVGNIVSGEFMVTGVIKEK